MEDTQRYRDLIVPEHRKPKLLAWLTTQLEKVDSAVQVAKSIPDAFSIESAVGVQLDVLGQLIGRSRYLNFQPSDSSSPVLDDDMYRMILRAKIVMNRWQGMNEELPGLWKDIFREFDVMVRDNQDMSIEAIIIGSHTRLEIELVEHGYIVPKPEGVRLAIQLRQILGTTLELHTRHRTLEVEYLLCGTFTCGTEPEPIWQGIPNRTSLGVSIDPDARVQRQPKTGTFMTNEIVDKGDLP